MIFVTLGTQDKPFRRLIEAVEKQVEKGAIPKEETVIVQAGCTPYETKTSMQILDYVPTEQFRRLLKEADIVITHAGVGSLIEGLKQHKKMIVAARKVEEGEHVNNHQEQILQAFSEQGYILPLIDFETLGEQLKQAKNFTPKQFVSNHSIFLEKMEQEIEELLNR